MTTPSESSPSPSPITEDLPCLLCSYNLRTLLPTANCPECNFPISSTLSRFKWRNIDPAYLLQLKVATRMLIASLFLIILSVFSSYAIHLLPQDALIALITSGTLTLFYAPPVFVRWWSISLIANAPRYRDGSPASSRHVRALQILNLTVLVAFILSPFIFYVFPPFILNSPGQGYPLIRIIVLRIQDLLHVLLYLQLFIWIAKISDNIAQPSLSRLFQIIASIFTTVQMVYISLDLLIDCLYLLQDKPFLAIPSVLNPLLTARPLLAVILNIAAICLLILLHKSLTRVINPVPLVPAHILYIPAPVLSLLTFLKTLRQRLQYHGPSRP